MQLNRPFAKLPLRFCAETLAAEMARLPAEAWVAHPDDYPGNDAVLLVTPGGELVQGRIGAMGATAYLDSSPYARQVMASLGCVWSRSRYMGLGAGAQVAPHVDVHYHWRNHWRLHIPVVTNPDVRFTCGGETVQMAPGECWMFDSFRMHDVMNGGSAKRIHLVLDTVGGGRLHELLDMAQGTGAQPDDQFVAPDGRTDHQPQYEQFNAPRVMSPWEMDAHIAFLLDRCQPAPNLAAVRNRLSHLVGAWRAEWAMWADAEHRVPHYLALALAARDDVIRLGVDRIRLENGLSLLVGLRQIVFLMAAERPEQRRGPPAGTANPDQ